MDRQLLVAVVLAVSAAPVSAQAHFNFNLDFGDPTNTVSTGYAGAGWAGYWNGIRADIPNVYTLYDLDYNLSNVTFWQTGAAGSIYEPDPSLTGEEAPLMDDGVITYTQGVDSCFYFNNLQPGMYELITYAWRPNHPTQMARTVVDNTPGVEITGGAWPGQQVHGITYARHIVTVDGSGSMVAHCGLAAGSDPAVGAVCNGMQLRRLDEFEAFCFGDNSALCPCGNQGSFGHGCENSSSTGGALLTGSGMPSVSADTAVLSCIDERPTAFSIVLQGDNAGAPVAYGDGLRCVSGTLKRLYARNAVGGAVTAPQGADPSISARSAALGDTISPGESRFYQVYYRDPSVTFCPAPMGNTWNISNEVRAIWIP